MFSTAGVKCTVSINAFTQFKGMNLGKEKLIKNFVPNKSIFGVLTNNNNNRKCSKNIFLQNDAPTYLSDRNW